MTDSAAHTLRTQAEIEADIEAARARLTSTLEDLISNQHPKVMLGRRIDQFREKAEEGFRRAKAQIINEDGTPRTDRVLAIGGAIAGVLTLIGVARFIGKTTGQQ